MKLIDYMVQKTGESEEYIISLACPSSYGPEFDKYEGKCGDCQECWGQEIEGRNGEIREDIGRNEKN